MRENSVYQDYDVPQNLQFKTHDIINLGGLKCSCVLRAPAFENILQAPNRIVQAEVELSFSLASQEILVRGKIKGTREIQCARCLKMTRQPFSEDFSETYSHKSEIIDIMLLVRQTLALTEEIRFLCKPDCRGICPQCGQDLNVSPCKCQPENLSPFAVLKGKFK